MTPLMAARILGLASVAMMAPMMRGCLRLRSLVTMVTTLPRRRRAMRRRLAVAAVMMTPGSAGRRRGRFGVMTKVTTPGATIRRGGLGRVMMVSVAVGGRGGLGRWGVMSMMMMVRRGGGRGGGHRRMVMMMMMGGGHRPLRQGQAQERGRERKQAGEFGHGAPQHDSAATWRPRSALKTDGTSPGKSSLIRPGPWVAPASA